MDDLSKRFQREAAMRAAIEESMQAGVAVVDTGGAQVYVNRAFAEMLGFTREELLGARPPYVYWPPEEIANIQAAFEQTLAGAAPKSGFELRFARNDGSRFDALVQISELRGVDPGFLAVVYDVTERKQAERRLAESERTLRILAEASEVVASALDYEAALRDLARLIVSRIADYCITYSLDAGGDIRRVGLAHRVPEKQGLVEDLVRAGPPRVDDPFGSGAVIREGTPILATDIPADLLARAAQNEEHLRVLRELSPRSSIVVPMQTRGRIIGAIALAHTADSGRSYTEADLVLAAELARRAALLVDNARLYREARDAVRVRDDVVGVISHDLRNPIQAIQASAGILTAPGATEDKREQALSVIERCTTQMEHLIEGLLEVTQIEGGGLRLDVGAVDPAALVDESCALFGSLADEGEVTLERRAPPDLPRMRGDRRRLVQVVSNLLGNALKFTPKRGRIVVAAAADPLGVRISVADDGPGIPSDQLPHLFDRFWQVDGRASRGIGLGLAIAKGLVDAHGGTIGVSSTEGRGSTFHFTIPAA